MRFTKEKAFEMCNLKLPFRVQNTECYECYYHDGQCELGLDGPAQYCGRFRADINYTNRVRRAILNNPKWCKNNWDKLCQVDKELFYAIHGGYEEMEKVKCNCKGNKDLDEIRLSLIKMLFNDDMVLLSYSKEADECNSEINVELTFKVV